VAVALPVVGMVVAVVLVVIGLMLLVPLPVGTLQPKPG
jgi:hypothetical protein